MIFRIFLLFHLYIQLFSVFQVFQISQSDRVSCNLLLIPINNELRIIIEPWFIEYSQRCAIFTIRLIERAAYVSIGSTKKKYYNFSRYHYLNIV